MGWGGEEGEGGGGGREGIARVEGELGWWCGRGRVVGGEGSGGGGGRVGEEGGHWGEQQW